MLHNQNGGQDFAEGPWNPGIGSELTRDLLALSTLFRTENVFNDLQQAIELRDVTGLPLEELAIFRPERLALHEVLVRVTADFEVPDPESATIRSLGVNFRQIVQVVLSRAFEPSRSDTAQEYDRLKRELAGFIEDELSAAFASTRPNPAPKPPTRAPRSLWGWLRTTIDRQDLPVRETDWDHDERVLREWRARAKASDAPLQAVALRSLVKAASAVRLKQGRIPHQQAVLGLLATNLACNEYGGQVIGHIIEPKIREVAEKEGFQRLPAQDRPVLMVTKGASASGKSTMRPLQRTLAAQMGVQWSHFALISPDIWRRVLLDFGSLGPLYKYAGMLTGQELDIIDQKLDRYLVRKGEQGLLSHLLIDRFRFDSFALDSEESRSLVSRFGKLLCYFFMITPPHETVERAWRRGLEVGRYKAVDDLLAHNVDAFIGMQNILFGRALTPNDCLHYEFLDNDVPRGEGPLTVAFGWGGEMNILDVRRMLDVCRYRKINVNAKSRSEVYPDERAMAAERNVSFLASCIRKFPQLNFADRDTRRIYAHFAAGRLEWVDRDALDRAVRDPEVQAALSAAAPNLFSASEARLQREPGFLPKDRFPTLGRWERDA
jgi:hypothetical protein